MVKSVGATPRSTSSQLSGVAAGAARSGRRHHVAAMFLPSVFMPWSRKIASPRRPISQVIVVRSGAARLMSANTAPTQARTSVAGWTRSTGTYTCMPVAPDVRGYPRRPSPSSTVRTSSATSAASAKVAAPIGSRSKNA